MQGRGSVTTRVLAALAIGAAATVLVSGCSSHGEFPAVLDHPTPRDDVPLSAEQVKQATDALISERDHLSAEAQTGGAASAAPPNPAPANAPAGAAPIAAANAASGVTQTAGADSKP